MQHDMTDKEQVEQLKQWMKDYGWSLLLAVLVGLGLSYGWRTWKERTLTAKLNASNLYAAMQVMAVEKNQTKLNEYAAQLVTKHANSIYASLGQLLKAQQLASKQQYTQAQASLDWVKNRSKLPAVVRDMAYFSNASLYMQQKQEQPALQQLDKISVTFAPVVWQQKAMLYQEFNDSAKAVVALTKAKELYAKQRINNPLVSLLLAQYPLNTSSK